MLSITYLYSNNNTYNQLPRKECNIMARKLTKEIKPGLTPGETARPVDDEGYPYKLLKTDDLSQRATPVHGGKLEVPKKPTYTPNVVLGEGSHKLDAYKLPVCETDKERRSFPGWHVMEPNPELMDAVSYEGTT